MNYTTCINLQCIIYTTWRLWLSRLQPKNWQQINDCHWTPPRLGRARTCYATARGTRCGPSPRGRWEWQRCLRRDEKHRAFTLQRDNYILLQINLEITGKIIRFLKDVQSININYIYDFVCHIWSMTRHGYHFRWIATTALPALPATIRWNRVIRGKLEHVDGDIVPDSDIDHITRVITRIFTEVPMWS